MNQIGTYYIPEGASRTIKFAPVEGGETIITDDRGTLIALVYVAEAESEKPLMLKQYGASALVGTLTMLFEHEIASTDDWITVTRNESGEYETQVREDEAVEGLEDAM